MTNRLVPPSLFVLLLCPAALAADAPPEYPDHRKLDVWRDAAGEHPIKTPADWAQPPGAHSAGHAAGDGQAARPLELAAAGRADHGNVRRPRLHALQADVRRRGERPGALLPVHSQGTRRPPRAGHPGPAPDDAAGQEGAGRPGAAAKTSTMGWNWPAAVTWCWCPTIRASATTSTTSTPTVTRSGSMKGIFNHMRAVDLLGSRPEVDPQRIGAIGHSLGGHNAMFVGVFDERIKVIVSSCGWTPFHHYYGGKLEGWTSDRYVPAIRDVYKLDPEQSAVRHVRDRGRRSRRAAFFSISPLHDSNFDVEGVRQGDRRGQADLRSAGRGRQAASSLSGRGHDFPPKRAARSLSVHRPHSRAHAARGFRRPNCRALRRTSRPTRWRTFSVHDGFRIEQVAAEPLVASPVADGLRRGRAAVCRRDARLLGAGQGTSGPRAAAGRHRRRRPVRPGNACLPKSFPGPRPSPATTAACSSARRRTSTILKDTDGDGKADEQQAGLHRLSAATTCRDCSTAFSGGWTTAFTARPAPTADWFAGRTCRTSSPSRSAVAISRSIPARWTCGPRAAVRSTA